MEKKKKTIQSANMPINWFEKIAPKTNYFFCIPENGISTDIKHYILIVEWHSLAWIEWIMATKITQVMAFKDNVTVI